MPRYVVYMLAPVNVRVFAGSPAEARKRAEELINGANPGTVVIADGDSGTVQPVYQDEGSAWELDDKHGEPVEVTCEPEAGEIVPTCCAVFNADEERAALMHDDAEEVHEEAA